MDYRVRAGDTLSGIAARFDVTLAELEHANPHIVDPNVIFVNELVHVPIGSDPPDDPATVPAHVITYVVQSGDTKSGIAAAHSLELGVLEAANPQVTDPDLIHIGQVLNIPSASSGTSHTPASRVIADGRIDISAVSYDPFGQGGTLDGWILDAVHTLDVPENGWLAGYRVLCRRESSGRANAVNTSDSNANGPIQKDHCPLHCSRGVAQCIPDTFAAYHVSGTTSEIYDPVANIAASMHYVMSRYGVARDGSNLAQRVQQADPNRAPMGY